MRIGIGIDTGGTYTDAVIYDFDNNKILATGKAPTTKKDLSVGIINAIDCFPKELTSKVKVISLSTTLATNACVEDRGGDASLIFLGGDINTIKEIGEDFGLPPADEIYVQQSYTEFGGAIKQDMDWDKFKTQIVENYQHSDGLGIVEIYAMKNGAVVEKKAKEMVKEVSDIPVICGHELFSELSGLRRCASTLLNVNLLPVIDNFIKSIKVALNARDVDAKIIIVRSDGTLMSEKFATRHPVETLLSGPAASLLGAVSLTRSSNSIILDMGGTTTDIALVKDNVPVTMLDGVNIGRWKTYVDGLYVKTLGLGGDTAVHYNDSGLYLENYKVTPLCVAANEYPEIIDNLERLLEEKRPHTRYLYEHFLLVKDISENGKYTAEEKEICNALQNGPVILEDLAQAVGKDVYTINYARLVKDEVIEVCGLTPTDIMHIKGDFNDFSLQASLLASEFAAYNLDLSISEFADQVYTEVKRKLYLSIVEALFENQYPDLMENGIPEDIERMVNESFYMTLKNPEHSLLNINLSTDFTIVGLGAPIEIFIRDVAEMLDAPVIVPEYHHVANALGAVVSKVSTNCTIKIRPTGISDEASGFNVYADENFSFFRELEDAEAYAIKEAKRCAYDEAIKRGANGNIVINCETADQKAPAYNKTVHLETTVVATAIGNMRF